MAKLLPLPTLSLSRDPVSWDFILLALACLPWDSVSGWDHVVEHREMAVWALEITASWEKKVGEGVLLAQFLMRCGPS